MFSVKRKWFLQVGIIILLCFSVYIFLLARVPSERSVNREEPVSTSPVTQVFTVNPTSFTPSVDAIWPELPPEVNTQGSCASELWQYFVSNISDQLLALDRTNISRRLSEESKTFINNMVLLRGAECQELAIDLEIQRATVNFVIRSSGEHDDLVTFVTAVRFNEVDRLNTIMDYWKAAISVAVYIPAKEVPGFLVKLCTWHNLMNRNNVDMHLLLADGKYYPLNRLRNIAVKNTKTKLSFLCDVDLIPGNGTEELITEVWKQDERFFDKNVLVVPSFEMLKEEQMPDSKDTLIYMCNDGVARRHRFNAWTEASSPTDYKLWKRTRNVLFYPIDFYVFYEPYIVMKTSLVPEYPERFIGNRYENASLPLEIWCMGLHYQVSAKSFLIYYPSNYTALLEPQPGESQESKCTTIVKGLFIRSLVRKYHMKPIPRYQRKPLK